MSPIEICKLAAAAKVQRVMLECLVVSILAMVVGLSAQAQEHQGRNGSLSEVEVFETENSGVRSESEFVSSMAPRQVVVDEKRDARLPCGQALSSPTIVVNGVLAPPVPSKTIGNAASVFW